MCRLNVMQKRTIVESAQSCFGDNAGVWLFGSRADPKKHGGDIDLYIETDLTKGIVAAKLKMRSLIWPLFGEQKIDIIVRSRSEKMNPIHKIAKESGIELF